MYLFHQLHQGEALHAAAVQAQDAQSAPANRRPTQGYTHLLVLTCTAGGRK